MNKPMTTKEMEKWIKEAWEKAQSIPEVQTEAEKIAYCKGWWDALKAHRKWFDTHRTHSEDCYKWHHECAIAKIERGQE